MYFCGVNQNTKNMNPEEILTALREGANFEMEHKGAGGWCGIGSISRFPECRRNGFDYVSHYNRKKKILESLPWTKVVDSPRNPRPDEYPTVDGEYITMLDCNEHEVICNTFRDGRFLLYDKTHVKWWMPNPFEKF